MTTDRWIANRHVLNNPNTLTSASSLESSDMGFGSDDTTPHSPARETVSKDLREPPPLPQPCERLCVVLVSHFVDSTVRATFERLRLEIPPDHDLFLLLSLKEPDASLTRGFDPDRVMQISQGELLALPYPEKCSTAGWQIEGNLDLAFLAFRRRQPGYDRFWFIEYDVHYQGCWGRFFSHFRDSSADVLGTILTPLEQVPQKLKVLEYPKLKGPSPAGWSISDMIKGFFPICRLSAAALDSLDAAYRSGVGGHYEITLPTIAANAGLLVEDIGGRGQFVRPDNLDRFYFANPASFTHSPGTFVFRPSLRRVLPREDTLWHPVKPPGAPVWFPTHAEGSLTRRASAWVKARIWDVTIRFWFATCWNPLPKAETRPAERLSAVRPSLMSRFSARTMQVVLLMLAGAALRIYGIGTNSLWNDELFSRWYPELLGVRFMWSEGLAQESSPPGYYTILYAWMSLFGTSDVALRALSVLASTLAIPLVYCLGRELFDRSWRVDGHRAALIGAAVFAVMPMQLHFAQEARTYALLLLPVGGVLFAVARLLAEASQTTAPVSMRTLVLYGSCGTVSLYLHATAALLLAAAGSVVVLQLLRRHRPGQAALFVATNLVVAVFAAPALLGMASQTYSGVGLEWIPQLRARDVAAALSAVVTGPDANLRFPGAPLTAAVLGAVAFSLLRYKPEPRPALVLLGVPVLFLTLVCLLSLWQPILLPRVMCWVDMPLALILGWVLCSPYWRAPAATLAAAFTGGLLVYFLLAPGKEPWHLLGQRFAAELTRADLVALAPHTGPGGLASYAPLPSGLRHWQAGTPNIETGPMVERFGVGQISRSDVEAAIRAGQDVMLIYRPADRADVAALLHDVSPPTVRMQAKCGDEACLTLLEWPAR